MLESARAHVIVLTYECVAIYIDFRIGAIFPELLRLPAVNTILPA